ncbi:MAG: DMT family transporter [Cyanobacteria bacterium P01_D01_bin.123]
MRSSQGAIVQKMRWTEWLLLCVLSVLWGGSFFFNAIAVRELSPLTLLWGRTTLAAMALLVWVYVSGKQMPRSPQIWRSFIVMGVFNNAIPFSLIAWGQTSIDSGLAAILNATTPVFGVILAHFCTRDERLTRSRALGVSLSLLGVVVLMGSSVLRGLDVRNLGQLAVLTAACSYAIASLYGRRFQAFPPAVTAAGMLTCTATFSLPLVMFLDRPWTLNPALATLGAVAGLALIGTALSYLIFFRLLATAGATNAMLVTFLIPVSALFLGAILLEERIQITELAGMALIFAGLAAIDGRIFTAIARQPSIETES